MFQVLFITLKTLHGLSPAYLLSLLQEYPPPQTLRSSSKSVFIIPTVNSVTYREHTFSFYAPTTDIMEYSSRFS